jgi:hypothetical protein
VVVLHAAPAAGRSFVRWEGGCTGTATSTTVTVTGSVSCTARFTQPVTISITKAGSGSGTVTATTGTLSCGARCSAVYDAYVPVELVATPAAGSRFAGWSGDADCADGRLGPEADTHCVATFIQTYPLSVTKTGAGSDAATVGSGPAGITCGPGCSGTFDAGTTLTLTAQPPSGFIFVGWTGAGCATGVVVMDQARACTATFRFDSSKVAPANGATWNGSTVMLSWTSTPKAGYWVCLDSTNNNSCDGMWWPNGAATTREWGGLAPGTYYWQVRVQTEAGTFAADAGTWWRVTVPPPRYTLTVTKTGAASGAATVTSTPSGIACGGACSATYDGGTTVTLHAVPFSGFTFAGWSGSGCTPSGGSDAVVTMDTARSCTAAFRFDATKLAPANGAGGQASVVTLSWSATPEAGYFVCLDSTNDNSCDGMTWWPNGAATTREWGGLAPGTYYWQVRAQTGAGTFETNAGAWWSFTVVPPPIPPDHWKAEYFSNTGLSGSPTTVVDEGTGIVDHDWGTAGPSGLPSDNFSARFTRTVTLAGGRYRFSVVTDDGSRLWVDDQLKIDAWWDQAPTTYTADRGAASRSGRAVACARTRSMSSGSVPSSVRMSLVPSCHSAYSSPT